MVRSVSDAALLLMAMLTPAEDQHLEDIRKGKAYHPSIPRQFKGLKIALLTSIVQENSCHKTSWAQYLKAITLAKDEGAEVVEKNIPSFEAAISTAFTMTLAQASEIHYERLAENPDGFGDDVRLFLEQGHLISAVDYIRAQRIRAKLVDEALKTFQEVDAWILPTTPNPATRVGEPPDPLNARFTGPINLLGFPSLVIPSGLTDEGLPVSLQIIAAPFHEYLLLEIAKVFEDGLAFPKELPIWLRSQNY